MKKNTMAKDRYKEQHKTRHKGSSDVLDWSYVELQEHDFLESQDQEISYAFKDLEE